MLVRYEQSKNPISIWDWDLQRKPVPIELPGEEFVVTVILTVRKNT